MADADYSKVFETYNKLPQNVKKEFDDFRVENYSKGSPPPEQMQKDLEGILARHRPKTKSPVAAPNASDNQRLVYAAGLFGIALLLGMPYL